MRRKEVDSKSEINSEAEKAYSSGEHATLCGVSVRTVNITMEKASYHHQASPKAVDASMPKPMLLGANKLPGKLHIVGCVLLNARAIGISVVRRHGGHPKMNRHVAAL